MASRLDSIIRLRKWELDEERRTLADMQGARDALTHQLDMLAEEVVEQRKAASLEVFSTTVGAYMDGVRRKQDLIALEIQAMEKELNEQRDKVAEGFRELKTFEIDRDREEGRRAKAELLEEQQEFDELAIQAHARGEAALDSDTLNRRQS